MTLRDKNAKGPSIHLPRNLNGVGLVPSIGMGNLSKVRELSRFFKELEFDMIGIRKQDRDARLCDAESAIHSTQMRAYSIHTRGFDLSLADDIKVAAFIDLCNKLHTLFHPKIAVIHGGYGDMGLLAENLGRVLEGIPGDLTLAIENLTKQKTTLHSPETISRFVNLLSELPQNVGVCIDTTHPAFGGSKNQSDKYTSLVLEFMDAAMPRLKHMHFSDRAVDVKPKKHRPLGSGIIQWERIVGFLVRNSYDGKAALEVRSDEDLVSMMVSSARCIGDFKDKDINGESVRETVSENMSKEEFLGTLASLPKVGELPNSLLEKLEIPDEGILEETEDSKYLIVPSAGYQSDHADPYDVLAGESDDKIKWAEYVFGVRYHGSYLSALLIDKKRKISVEWPILSAQPGIEKSWAHFESAMVKAIEELSLMQKNRPESIQNLDHILVSGVLDLRIIEKGTSLAWG